MAAIDFPTSPTDGQVYTAANGQQWKYESATTSWRSQGANTDITIGKASPAINLNAAAAGQFRVVSSYTAGVQRWALALGDNSSESGSNAGSDFQLLRYSDAGAYLGSPIYIRRSDGLVAMVGGLSFNGSASAFGTGDAIMTLNKTASGKNDVIYGYTNGVLRWGITFGDSTAESGSDAGSNMGIYRFSDAGAFVNTALLINRATGVIDFEKHPTVGSVSYACRAWVNFNGSGTVAINASANVTSITDNGVGDYTINFTAAMSDANFSAVATSGNGVSGGATRFPDSGTVMTTSSVRIQTVNFNGSGLVDPTYVTAAVFR